MQDKDSTKSNIRKDIEALMGDYPEAISEKSKAAENNSSASGGSLPMNRLVVSILGITALSNSAYAIIAPFLPFEFKKKEIDQTWIGYIFAIYSVAVVMCSPLVGKMIAILGRRNLIVFGMLLMGTSFIVFGCITELENREAFITLALLNRFL